MQQADEEHCDGKYCYRKCCGPISFVPGEETNDGHPTYRLVCVAGIVGGCKEMTARELTEFDRRQNSTTRPMIAPRWQDPASGLSGRSWQTPDFAQRYPQREFKIRKAGRQ